MEELAVALHIAAVLELAEFVERLDQLNEASVFFGLLARVNQIQALLHLLLEDLVHACALLVLRDKRQRDEAYFVWLQLGQSFVVEVAHHLVELHYYFSHGVRVVRHRLVVTAFQAPFEASQRIVQRIWVVFVIELGLKVALAQHMHADVILLAVE